MTNYIYSKKNSFTRIVSLVTYITTVMLLLSSVYNVNAQCNGPVVPTTISIGPGLPETVAGGFTTIANALGTGFPTSLGTTGISAPVILELQSGYTSEVSNTSLVISNNVCFTATNDVTIRPAPGVNGKDITSSVAGPTIDMNGAQFIKFDGTPGGTTGTPPITFTAAGSNHATLLNIRNTSATGSAIKFDNSANNITIKYCDLQGQNTTNANVPAPVSPATAGVIYFENTGATGNDLNTIDHCNIHSTTNAAFPTLGVYSIGPNVTSGYTTASNDNNTISNCNIYDFSSTTTNSAGLELNYANNAWAITDNSFFQTASRSIASTFYNRPIWLTTYRGTAGQVGNGFNVSQNFIGGSQPLCAGTAYTMTTAGFFDGIRLEVADVSPAVASSIQGNTIKNISLTSTTTAADPFHGILVTAGSGNVNIGTVSGNTIGSTAGVNLITIASGSTTGFQSMGIGVFNGTAASAYNISNNKIGGINLGTATTANSFAGIYTGSAVAASIVNIDNNTVGRSATTDMINVLITNTTSTWNRGIVIAGGTPAVTITNNTVTHLNNTTIAPSAGSQTAGILVSPATAVSAITGNVVRDLSCASPSTNGGSTASLIGIALAGTPTVLCDVSNNTVDSLVNTNTGTAVASSIYAMWCNFSPAAGMSTYSNNFIQNIFYTAANTSGVIRGLETDGGTVNIFNNVIRLGLKPDGSFITTPMSITGILKFVSGNAGNIYFNSVYIGGTGVTAGAANSVAFSRYAIPSSGVDSIRNNVFVNARSGAGAGRHYAIHLNQTNGTLATTANTFLSNNVYRATGTNGYFAGNGTGTSNDVATYSQGWFTGNDINSWNLDPQFIAPTAPAANLHISTSLTTPVEGAGTPISYITSDKDGFTRANLTPTDIGAYAGNYNSLPTCATPGVPGSIGWGTITSTVINGTFGAASGADSYLIVRYDGGASPVTPPVNGANYSAGQSLGLGTVVAVTSSLSFSATGLFGGITYDFYVYSLNNICLGTSQYSAYTTASQSTAACTGLSGIVPIGPGQTYTSLTSALNYLITLNNGLAASTILELQSNYNSSVENFPIVIGNILCAGPAKTLTIRPASGAAGLSIINTATTGQPTISLNGAAYVIIDGRPGGTGGFTTLTNLVISNTLATPFPAIQFINDANLDTLKYCDLKSNNIVAVATAGAGVINFSTTAGANGNDNNVVTNCDIHNVSGGNPTVCINGIGTTTTALQNNDNNTISNCNIYDYFSATVATAGIYIGPGNGSWNITNNHFYQTSPRTNTTAAVYKDIQINNPTGNSTGSGFVITGNFIGGSNNTGTGTPYTLSGVTTYSYVSMLISVGIGATTIIQNDTISNIDMTTAGTGGAVYLGIDLVNGKINCSTNMIGSNTVNGAIKFTSSAPAAVSGVMPLRSQTTMNTVTFTNNTISGIDMYSTVATGACEFHGVNANGATVSLTATGNTIGSTTLANSINVNSTSASSTIAPRISGFIINPSATYGTMTFTNDTVANINSSYIGAAGSQAAYVKGFNLIPAATGTSMTVTGNVIFNLSSASIATGSGISSAINGIGVSTAFTGNFTISGNKVYNLKLTGASTTAPVQCFGIYYSGPTAGANIITKNFVHSLSLTANNPAAIITGIECGGGVSTYSNNMVRLGIDGNASDITVPLAIKGILKSSATANNFYFNSVYIGGSGAGTNAVNTAAFIRTASGTDDVRDNIFVNNRSNATTGGKHYAINLASTTTLTLNYNIYYGNGNGFVFGFNGSSDFPAYSAGWLTGDANSWAVDPRFNNPTGNSSSVDLHISTSLATAVEGQGILVSVTDDCDGQTRSGLTPVDIGADADNFTAPSACATPGIPGIPSLTPFSPTQINGSFTGSGADNYLIVRYDGGATPVTPPANGINYTAGQPLGSGTVVAVTPSLSFSATGLLGGTLYDFYVYSLNNICIGTSQYSAYSTNSQTTASCIGLTGIVPIGPGQPNDPSGFTSLTNAMTYLNTNGLTASTFLELQSTYNSSVETFPIVIGSIPCSGPSKILTIRPAGAAVTITSANTTAAIDINGATYVNIDGRPGGTGTNKYLIIENTSTTAGSAGNAILVRNESRNNLITYCEVRSANSNAAASTSAFTIPGNVPGAIAIGTSTGTNGNDNNTISYCDVHSLSSGGNLGAGIFAYNATTAGTAANNDNNTIDNCNIYDFYLQTTVSAGINVSLGNNSWTISNNHVYQTGTRDYGAGTQTVRGLWIIPNTSASGFVISGNYLGGNASNGSGIYTMTGTAAWFFNGIDISVGLGTATSVQGNTIANINMTTANASPISFVGYNIANGNVNVGTVTGNLFGSTTSTTGSHSITFTTSVTLGGVVAFRSGAGGTINIANNTAAGIDLIASANTIAPSFTGIFVPGGTTINVTNDTIGSATVPNCINLVSTSAASASASVCRGIVVSGGTTSTVSGNLIANINSNYSATGAQLNSLGGISVSASTSTVTGNTIRNLTSATQTTGSGASSAIIGIAQTTASAGITVSRNTIHSLRLTNPGLAAGAGITGIFIAGPTTGTNVVSRNNIHSFSLASTTTTAGGFTGITVSTGITTYANNMIRLGYDESGNEITAGILLRGFTKGAPNANNFYHNSVYIGGTHVISSSANTFAFQRSFAPPATPNDDIRDNIFVNNRSNLTTGGTHYVFSATQNAFLTLNNNVYYFNGTGGVFALNITTPVPSYITNWLPGDASSYPVDPLFINPTGSAATGDLHIDPVNPTIVESSGTLIAAVPDDFDGQTRASLTPTDIGADAGDFANLVCNGTPPSGTAIYSGSTDNICVSGSKTLTLSNFPSTPGLTLQWQESATQGGPYTNVTGGSGATTITFTTPTITQTMYYICLVTCINGGLSTPSSEKAVVVDDPQVLTTTPGTTCGPGTVTLSATASAGASISWFTALTGGSALSSFPYLNVPVTGFNNDVVANGVGDGTNGTTLNTVSTGNMNGMVTQPGVGMDGAGNTFIDGTYQWYTGSTLPTCFLPANGQIPSALTSGLTYQLNSYSGLNALTIESNTYGGSVWPTAGAVTLATPASYSTLKVLYETVSNSAGPTITATLTFTDATTQVITGNTFVNWMTATGVAYTPHISRAQNVAPGNPGACNIGPYLFEMTLPVSAANYNKLIQSITFNFSSTGGSTATTVDYLHVLALGGVIPPFMNSYTTPVIFAATPYYVQASIGSCNSTPRTLVNADYTTPPALTLTSNQNVCVNMIAPVSVTSNLSNFSSYTWAPITNLYSDAAATIPLTALDNLTTVYFKSSTVGSNSVTATATGGGCTNIVSTSVSTIAGPAVTITTTPNAVCPGGNIQLNAVAAGTNTYSWAANPTLSATNISNPVAQNIQSSQTYSVTVTAASSGCSTTQTVNAFVNEVPDPSFSNNDGPKCEGSSLTLDGINIGAGQTTTGWLWSGPSFSSTSEDFTFSPATLANNGTYTLTITNNFGCTASITMDVTVNPNPVISIGTQTNVSCNGLSTGSVDLDVTSGTPGYLFDLDGNTSSNGIYGGLAAGPYTATVTDVNGCSSTSLIVTITEPPVLTVGAGSNTPLCSGTSLNLSATPVGGTSGYSYAWTGPNGPIPSVQNPTIASATVLDAGNYSVLVTDAHSCTAVSANHLVQVNASPTAAIALVGSPNKCLGQTATVSLTFTGTGPWNYTVSGSGGPYTGSASGNTNINVTPTAAGTQTYTVTSVGNASCPTGGTSSGSATVYVSTAPPPSSGPIPVGPAEACANSVILITTNVVAGQNIRYSWNTGSNSSTVLFSTNIGGPFSPGPFQTTANQVYAQFGALGGGQSGYHVCMQSVNGCGSSINKCLWLRGVVNGPGAITPANEVVACPNDVKSYSCGASGGASVYNWTLSGSSTPITSGQGTTNVQVTFPAAFTSGQLCVTAALACGGASTSAPRCMTISKNPANPNVPTGAATVCPGATGVSYSIASVPGATGYSWTVPANATIATGANSPSITVNFPTPYNGSSSVCVTTTSACGASVAKCKTVVSGIPNQPAGITGPLTNVCGSTVQYSVVNPIASSYTWTNPAGTTIANGQGNSTILLNVSPTFTSGSLTVVANSAMCPPATSAPRTSSTIWGRPNTPGAITANPSVWCSGGYVNFSVTPAAPLPTYNWTISNGTIDAGQGNNNIDVTWGANAAGTVSVRASNGCGLSAGTSSQSFSSGCREEGINKASTADFSVYPNPAHDKVTVSIYVKEQAQFNVKLRDMSGRVILSEDHEGAAGLNAYNMDLKGFAKGIYAIEIQSTKESWKTKVNIE